MRTGELWDEMMAMERRMDDLFRGMFAPRARTYFPALPTGLRRPFIPAADVYVKGGETVMEFELPGIDPDKDVTVTVEDGDLVVKGERQYRNEISDENYFRMETSFGAFERRVSLPEGVTEKDVKAEYRDGILEIHLPTPKKELKAPAAKTSPIKVHTTKAA